MRTLQEKYNGVINENFSKKQFVRDARLELPNLITQFNGFEDTVTILKNRGMIQEAKKQEVPEYDKPAPGYSLEALERGIDAELEGMGINTAVKTPAKEDYDKAKEKAEKNLAKDPNHYLNLMSGDSKKVDKHDKYVEVKKNNHVDAFNGLKKAELKEGVEVLKEEMVDLISFLKQERGADNETIKDFLKMHFSDIRGASLEDVLDEFDNYLSVNVDYVDEKKGKDLDGDGDIDGDDYMAAKDKAIKGAMGKDVNEIGMFHDPVGYDKNAASEDKRALELTKALIDKGMDKDTAIKKAAEKFSLRTSYLTRYVDKYMGKDVNEAEAPGAFLLKVSQEVKSPATLAKALIDIYNQIQQKEQVDFATHSVFKRVLGLLGDMASKAEKPTQDAEQDPVNEGRRRKMKGGKVVTENDYETGGYVESMGPMLEKAMRQLEAVWEEWKAGPATEAAMVPHAKKDLVSYLESRITVGEDIVDEVSEEQQQLKEAFKAIITKLLTEEVITEAATGNLSKIGSDYENFEGMQAAINALENVVTDVESYYGKTKEKIQKVYDSFKDIKNEEGLAVGAFIGPAIEAAFKKDLMPVTEKGFTKGLEMPKVKMLKPGDIAEEELEEKETVFTPVNENKKYKYTKRQK